MAGKEHRLISRFLDTDGDGTGTKNAIGNYSGAAEEFFIAPAATETFIITRLLVSIEDGSGIHADEYGSIGSALTNGITLKETASSGVITDFTDGVPIKTNAHWGRYSFNVDLKAWGATPTNEMILCRWTFKKSSAPIRLVGADGGKLVVTLNDDLTGLISHYFMAEGHQTTILE